MDISVSKVTPSIQQAWIAKDDAIVFFGYQNHKPAFQKLLKEFKSEKSFSDGYILSTHKIPIIKIDTFEKFLRWREVNKYKR
ncbi:MULTISPECIES: hypothetical protein [unclassified Enterococcus]|uniref:hypothetical protein n=1 Tax=unclassified Enterococcus TaxID=2608891 RepID=UPI001552B11B|nr:MULTISPECIES: hypothetical protein [unclassified Enterococcus]MBS7578476.1 hypothetical protein [Enterococcus sp. MMGLQ5-2]MBS7585709.1 hypothetical protein [Enterococcus sp. MMGLQ5-1]NPD13568.1 hypothetical protein [Enterococcus sp. MMGLQ5-1]NPD38310.1 hypothetical protein [Enterococcus sp. MMGLQ5-2]